MNTFKKMFGGAAGGVLGCLGAVLALGLLATVAVAVLGAMGDDEPVKRKPPAASTEVATPDTEQYPNGDYVVGTDIPPGTYETSGAKSGLVEYCDVQTDGEGPGGDGFGQWKNASAPGERIIITLTEADGTLSINGCEPLKERS